MTTAELDAYLAQAISILEGNAAFFAPSGMPTLVGNLWNDVKGGLPFLRAAGGLTPEQMASLVAAGDKILAGEPLLISETAGIIAAIQAIRGEPVVMWLIAEKLSGNLLAKLQDAPGY